MNRRNASIGFLAMFVTFIIMNILAQWGYVQPEFTVANYYNSNAFWNFTFFEMLGGTFLMWPFVWFAIYLINSKLESNRNKKN
jgi:hypothetical protein